MRECDITGIVINGTNHEFNEEYITKKAKNY